MIAPHPTVTKGDRIVLVGCLLSLIPIILVLGILLLLYSALNSCAHNGPLSIDSDSSSPPPAEQPAPPVLPPTPPQATGGTDAPVRPEEPPAPAVVPPAPLPEGGGAPAPGGDSEKPQPPDSSPLTPADTPPTPSPSPTPTPAPHLRQTRWGMSPDEVLASEAPFSPIHTTANTLVYATTTRDYPCLLTYTFRNGRLSAARLQFSLPTSDDVPPLSPSAAHRTYLDLRTQLAARYGVPYSETHSNRPRDTTHLSDQVRQSREDADQYATSLAAARQRLAARTDQLKKKYRNWPEAAARIDRELASEHRRVADLEAWLADTQASEKSAQSAIVQSHHDDLSSPLSARDTVTWASPISRKAPHTVTLTADYTTLPSRLEIRYKTTLPLLSPDGTSEL